MNKPLHPSHRLFISKLSEIQQKSDNFYLYSRPVHLIIVQGIVISLKQSDMLINLTLDDSTGIVICTYYYNDFNPVQLKTGDLIRVSGRLTVYHQAYRLKLVQPPDILNSFDEEVDWAVSVKKLWKEVYTVETLKEKGKELIQRALKRKRAVCIYDVVKKIREIEDKKIDVQKLQELCGDSFEEFLVTLVDDQFLVQTRGDDLMKGEFCVSKKLYHPKEVIKAFFESGYGPLTLSEILQYENGKFADYTKCVLESIDELLSENYLFEISENCYDKIIRS